MKQFHWAIFGVCLLAQIDFAPVLGFDSVPIDSALFTIESNPEITSWDGNTLVFDLFQSTPQYGGFTQSGIRDTASLPTGIIGISFEITSTLPHPRISFGFRSYVGLQDYGDTFLANYSNTSNWTLSTFSQHICDYGDSGCMVTSLGAAYSPFILPQESLDFPQFALDFRADGFDGTDYRQGVIEFRDIRWVIVPEPSSSVITVCLIAFFALRPRP